MLTGVSQRFSPLQDTQWMPPHKINAINSEAVKTPPPSSLPEPAILDILSALKHLPDFSRLLANSPPSCNPSPISRISPETNRLGVDPNVRDVNGSTALHAAYLWGDSFVVDVLKARGSTPFIQDELGRSPAALTTAFPSASENYN